MKRPLLILIIVAAFVGVLALVYFLLPDENRRHINETVYQLFPGSGGEVATTTSPEENGEPRNVPIGGGGVGNPQPQNGSPLLSLQTFSAVKLFADPVAGFTYLPDDGGTVRFVEKNTGHISDYHIRDGSVEKVMNQTMLGIERVWWDGNNNPVVKQLHPQTGQVRFVYLSEDAPAPAEEGARYSFREDLRAGDRKEAVRFLQITLNARSDTQVAENGPGSPGEETNFFGPATKDALIRFQKKHESDIDSLGGYDPGVAGEATRIVLNKVNNDLFGTPAVPSDVVISEIHQTVLPNMLALAPSPDGDKLFTLTSVGQDTVASIGTFTNTQTERLFETPFSEWRAAWPTEESILLTTKPSGLADGYAYLYSREAGTLKALLRGIPGLTVKLNPSGNRLFYARTNENGRGYSSYIKSVEAQNAAKLPFNTFAEKCTWSTQKNNLLYCSVPKSLSGGTQPDNWYKGKTSFSDEVWLYDAGEQNDVLLYDPDDEGSEPLDVIDPLLDPTEQFFFFINKKDLSLWALRLGN